MPLRVSVMAERKHEVFVLMQTCWAKQEVTEG